MQSFHCKIIKPNRLAFLLSYKAFSDDVRAVQSHLAFNSSAKCKKRNKDLKDCRPYHTVKNVLILYAKQLGIAIKSQTGLETLFFRVNISELYLEETNLLLESWDEMNAKALTR